MGIKNLNKLLVSKVDNGITKTNISKLEDKIIAIDTSIILYQFITAIKSSTDELRTKDGIVTTHIHAILTKTLALLKKKIKPVFIFDGKAGSIKNVVLSDRRVIKNDARAEIVKINEKIEAGTDDLEKLQEEKIKLLKKSVSISYKQMKECQEIITLLGIPMIQAPEEADSQCAWLIKNNLVDYVASEDMDLLTFGTTKLIRGLGSKNFVTEYNLNEILDELEMTQDQFIDMCILLGCDYTSTIVGIGPKKAYDLIIKYGSIKKMLNKDKNFKNNKFSIPANFDYEIAQVYFKLPPVKVVEKEELVWKKPNYEELKKLLLEKYDYGEESVNKLFGNLSGGYYSVISGEKTKNQFYIDRRNYFKKLNNVIDYFKDSDSD
jgi:flap endonuclease-1